MAIQTPSTSPSSAPWAPLVAGPALTLTAVCGLLVLGPALPVVYGAATLSLLVVFSTLLGSTFAGMISGSATIIWLTCALAFPQGGLVAVDLPLVLLVAAGNLVAVLLADHAQRRFRQLREAEVEQATTRAVQAELLAANQRLERLVAARTVEVARDKAFVDALLARLPAAVAFFDRDLVLRWHNPAFAQLIGQPGATLTGKSPEACLGVAHGAIAPLLGQVAATRRPCEAGALPVGARAWDVGFVWVEDAHGVLALLSDVTERVETERLGRALIAELSEVDRAKEAFLGVLSHELRTPINVIMGYTSLMADGMVGPVNADQQGFLDRVLEGSETLLTLVNDMLDMGRIRAGRLTLAKAAVDFAELAAGTVQSMEAAAKEKGLTLVCDVSGQPPVVQADEQRAHQVLRILLSNAIKFTPAGGSITVRVRAAVRGLRVEVSDTGIGIDPRDLPRVFRQFEQVDASRTREHGGAGLGLAIAKSLIEIQGGVIGVDSAPGAGSTFWFELPGDRPEAMSIGRWLPAKARPAG